MGAFSIWHWIILLAILGVIALVVAIARSTPAKGKSELVGIGGWLAVLLVLHAIGSIAIVVWIYASFQDFEGLTGVPATPFAIFSQFAINSVTLAISLIVLWAGITKKRIFIRLYFYQWLATLVLSVLDIAILSVALEVPFAELLIGEEGVIATIALALDALCVWYLRVSVRVKNTMVN